MTGAFHCKTPDCAGWTVIGITEFIEYIEYIV
jgi:hypothetical protein